ncbi:VPS10_2 [Sanghuangporus weigelae]
MHPYDNRFALLSTLDGIIYRTSDQAMTWQTVVPPAPPSSYRNHFAFHFKVPGVAIFDGKRCVPSQRWPGEEICHTDYYITRDGFSSEPTLLLRDAQMCLFASSLKDIADKEHPDLILCVFIDELESPQRSSRLLASIDIFRNDKRVVDITLDGTPYQVTGITSRGKFVIAFLKSHNPLDLNLLKVISSDLQHWERLRLASSKVHHYPVSTFPLTESKLGTFEGYLGLPFTLYVSDAKGSNFVKSLENVINTGRLGTFEYDRIEGVEHVIMMSVVANSDETRELEGKQLRSRISFDDGSTWRCPTPSLEDASSARVASSYEGCDTFISTDAGLTWRKTVSGPYRFGYANYGSVIVLVKDVDDTDEMLYSIDSGQSWNVIHLGHRIIPIQLSPSSILTSENFLLIGLIPLQNNLHENRNLGFSSAEVQVLVVSLDFSSLDRQECTAEDDFEKWKGTEENCPCGRTDYECDANFTRQDGVCVSMIPDSIREDACQSNNKYSIPSGYRVKVGDTCDKDGNVILEEPVEKYRDSLEMPEGEEGHRIFVVPTPAETILTECPRSKWDL